MGFLEYGTPLNWKDSQEFIQYVKHHGLIQLLHQWEKNIYRQFPKNKLRWGEEIEFYLVHVDSDNLESSVYLDAVRLLEELDVREKIQSSEYAARNLGSQWHPEFGNHLIEAIPFLPYKLNLQSIALIEPNMRLRRAKIQSLLPLNKFVTSQTVFPRLGLKGSISFNPHESVDKTKATFSVFIPDALINPHPRFPTLVANIRARRSAKPCILIPLYQGHKTLITEMDIQPTDSPESCSNSIESPPAQNYANIENKAEECSLYYLDNKEANWDLALPKEEIDRFSVENLALKTINPVKDHIYMDCFAFGMGMSCVQTTWACRNISDARYLYDQMVVLSTIMLALTAATPYQRGLLSDLDSRWPTLEQAVDCRTVEEMSTIPKSRFSGVSKYISERKSLRLVIHHFNDTETPIDVESFLFLKEHGMDEILAKHFSHLWIRDPMVIFEDKIQLDDTQAVDHFENIQSTNWNSVRFKTPPPSSDCNKPSPISWRVEFRTPENQLTDFENAAGVAIISVLAQAILKLDLDFYIPMSFNDINMQRSWARDAITKKKFYFRKSPRNNFSNAFQRLNDIIEMSIFEILCGSEKNTGLQSICETFVSENCPEVLPTLQLYLDLYAKRASGEKMTGAQFLRDFVLRHPAYKNDCIISPSICHDLTVLSIYMGFGLWIPQAMFPFNCVPHIKQTPLNSKTKLPKLSSDALKIIKFHVNDSTNHEVDILEDKKFIHIWCQELPLFLTESRFTDLAGTISSLLRHPDFSVLRSSRRKRSRKSEPDLDVEHTSLIRSQSISATCEQESEVSNYYENNVIGLEDFTQAWISKGLDFVGGITNTTEIASTACCSNFRLRNSHE